LGNEKINIRRGYLPFNPYIKFEKDMGNLLYILAIVLVVMWLVGFLGFGDTVGGIIHILLVLAVVAFLLRVIRGA
jgi:hypothetical protein